MSTQQLSSSEKGSRGRAVGGNLRLKSGERFSCVWSGICAQTCSRRLFITMAQLNVPF